MKSSVIIILVLLIVSLQQTQTGDQSVTTQIQFAPSQSDDDPSRINNNTEFETQGWPGHGTSANPYLIENLIIDSVIGPHDDNAIHISDTDVFFVIKNCTLVKPEYLSSETLRFYNVTNGGIENCTITHDSPIPFENAYGLYIYRSSNIHISGCVVSGYNYGIYLYGSTRTSIKSTSFSNQDDYSIRVLFCNDTEISGNAAIGTGRRGTYTGIYVAGDCLNCCVISNSINNCSQSGIRIQSKVDVHIYGNIVTHSQRGVLLQGINHSLIEYNTFTNNDRGILVASDAFDNTLSNNVFGENDVNAEDRGHNNTWDSNWYSDYTGDGFYVIPGSAKSIDSSPQPTTLHIPNFINNIMILSLISVIPLGAAIGYHMRYREIDEDKLRSGPSLFFMVVSILIPFGASSSPLPDPSLPSLRYVVSDVFFTLGVSRSPGTNWVVSSILTPNDYLQLVSVPYLVGCVLSIVLLLGYLREKISGRIFSVGIFSLIAVAMLVANIASMLLVPITPLLALSIVFWVNRMKIEPEEKNEN
ncbi:MAG: NosD domain-containing protein [Candidatus Thorarchaeota archaeon]